TFLPPARTGVSPSAAAAATDSARAIRTYLRPGRLNCLTPGSFLGHEPSVSKDPGAAARPPRSDVEAGPPPLGSHAAAARLRACGPRRARHLASGSPFDGRRS